jgi:hypothetical protein
MGAGQTPVPRGVRRTPVTEEKIYLWMSIIGGGFLLLQVILQVIGLDSHADGMDGDVHVDVDVDHDVGDGHHHGNAFFGILSFKALVSFVAIFGLTGLTLLDKTDLGQPLRILYSGLAGFAAMLIVAWLMRMLHSLSSSGTVQLQNAVGREGAVYLRIPGQNEGRGKVTFELQGRTVELAAMTDGEELKTGARVRIVEVLGDETVRVAAV